MNRHFKIAMIMIVALFAVILNSGVSMAQEKKMSAREWADLASKTEPITPDAGTEGTAVADFEVPLYDGGTFKTADFKDKITFLTFWYST